MMRALLAVLAIAAAAPAIAQEQITAPAGFVPKQAIAFDSGAGTASAVSAAAPLPVAPSIAGSFVTNQVSAGTTATLVAGTRSARRRLLLSVGSANSCAFGNGSVTLSTGFALQAVAGASVTIESTAAIYAVCSAATTINVLDQF